ncbi:hypothetical protein V7124_19415 [Neobacillus niacini]|uniref:hypothetical protein n=1 Tax=Neobacillus niacini TaxID=86668 RepID=UPI002FFDCF27
MNKQLESLDLETNLGSVTLSNGQSLDIPKLSMLKIIKIVKFLGIDGSRLYNELREVLLDESLEDLEKFAVILESLDEKQLVHIFSIMLELKDDEVLKLDPNEMLEIAIVLVDEMDLKKTYSLIRTLMKKMFNKELPESLGAWFDQMKQNKAKQMEIRQKALAAVQAEQTDGKNS